MQTAVIATEIENFAIFGSCDLDLDLDLMTFIYELNPFILLRQDILTHRKRTFYTSGLSKVIVIQTYRQTDMRTDAT